MVQRIHYNTTIPILDPHTSRGISGLCSTIGIDCLYCPIRVLSFLNMDKKLVIQRTTLKESRTCSSEKKNLLRLIKFLGEEQYGITSYPTCEVNLRVFLRNFFLKSQFSGRAFNRYTERSILVGRTECFYFQCCLLTANNHCFSFIQDTILL